MSEVDRDLDEGDVWASLAVAREEYPVPEATGEHFTHDVRGGLWTRAHTGANADYFRASACSRVGRDFLSGHGMKQSGTFCITRYGDHACAVFCRYSVAKMAWLHSLSVDAVLGGTSVFADVEPLEFVELAESASGHVAERVRALKEIRPLSESEEEWFQSRVCMWFTRLSSRRGSRRGFGPEDCSTGTSDLRSHTSILSWAMSVNSATAILDFVASAGFIVFCFFVLSCCLFCGGKSSCVCLVHDPLIFEVFSMFLISIPCITLVIYEYLSSQKIEFTFTFFQLFTIDVECVVLNSARFQ